MHADDKATWRQRLIALSFYLGSPPFFIFTRKRRECPFLRHHFGQALALFGLLLALAILFFAALALLSALMLHARGFYESKHPEPIILNVFRKVFLCWLVFLLFGAGTALAGSKTSLPVVGRLGRMRSVRLCTVWSLNGILAAVLAVAPFACHAAWLARDSGRGAPVAYMLYEDLNIIPNWVFDLGFYRVSKAARTHWPPPAVKVVKISPASIAEAKAHGRFMFVGSHGLAHGLLLESGWLTPDEVAAMPTGARLEYVYLTGCDSGVQEAAWKAAFAPAQVVTYKRLTSVFEHAWWLWTKAPGVIHELAAGTEKEPAT